MARKKAMSSNRARFIREKGHRDAREFAILLGIGKEYKSDIRAKKDIIDSEGNSYSVKSGEKKWQIFLYSKKRFNEDPILQGINGLGDLFLKCIESFPENREDYLKNKKEYKLKLQQPMIEICKKLREKRILKAFLDKSIFNAGEVDFLVVKENNLFHVFYNKDVIEILCNSINVENSKARRSDQFDNQKVVFKYNNITIGEIEMRNDSNIHYREVKFWLDKRKTINLLISKINKRTNPNNNVKIILYGKAIKKIGQIINEYNT